MDAALITIDLHKLQGQSKENSSKLDLILSELSATASRNEDTSVNKEVERLLASEKQQDVIVQQLKQENERLTHQIEEISNAHENYRLKNEVEISSATTLLLTQQLREENTQLTRKLDETTRKEQDLASQYRKSQEQLECCETKCAEIELKFQSLTEEKDRQLALLQEQVEKHEREHARSLVEDNQKQVAETAVEEKVKMIMNKTYKEIMKQFRLNESYTLQSIKSIVSVVIRVK